MAKISRYDSPAESNYFNTFVPLPLDQITALGMKRQEDLERKQDLFSRSVDDASMIDYTPGSVDESRVKNEFLPQIQRLAEEAMSIDLSNPVEWAKYSTKIKRLSVSDDIKRIEQSAAAYKQALAVANEQRMRGVYNPLLDDTLKKAKSLDSRYEIFNYVPESQIDKSKLFEPYYKDIGQDYSVRVNVGTKENPLWVLRQGISDNKIRSIGAKAAQDLAATGGGNQIVRLARMENPALYADMTDREILESQMYEYGKSRADFKDQILPENMQGSGRNTTEGVFDLFSVDTRAAEGMDLDPVGINEILNVSSVVGDTSYNNLLKMSSGPGQGKAGVKLGYSADYKREDKLREQMRAEQESKAADKIRAWDARLGKDSKGNDLSNEDVINGYKEMVGKWKNMSNYVYSFGNDQVNSEFNNRAARTASFRMFVNPDKQTPQSYEEIAKYYGYTPEEFLKAMANSNDPNVKVLAPSAFVKDSGYTSIQITPKNKKSTARKEILMTNTNEEKMAFRPYYDLLTSIRSGTYEPTVLRTDPNTGRSIIAKPVPNVNYGPDGKPSLDFSVSQYMIDRNGNVIEQLASDQTLDSWYRQSVEKWANTLNLSNDTKNLQLERQYPTF